MSKKTKLFIAMTGFFAIATTGMLHANPNYGMAGCGLGSMLIGPKGELVKENSKLQIFAATTNGTSGTQTFGITTGTSNCVENAAAYKKMQQEVFVSVNYKSLEQEMAAGKGEKIGALAHLMGCPTTQTAAFGRMAQNSYKSIYKPVEQTPAEFLVSLKTAMGKDKTLAHACNI